MRYVCGECGRTIPDGMDFCPQCGCVKEKAVVLDDSGTVRSVCPKCGVATGPGDIYCGSCGAELPRNPVQMPMMMPRMRRNAGIAILLAAIPGFFNIYGLGHLVLGKWSRGIMFLIMTAVIWYLNGWHLANASLFIMVINLCVFIYQVMDIMRLAYEPEDRRWTGRRSTVPGRSTA